MFWPSSSASYRCLLSKLLAFGLLGMKEWRKMIVRINSFIPRKLKASLGGVSEYQRDCGFRIRICIVDWTPQGVRCGPSGLGLILVDMNNEIQ